MSDQLADIPAISDASFADLLADPYPIYERARALGGTFRIEDRIGGGTRLNVYCPGTDDSGFNAIVD